MGSYNEEDENFKLVSLDSSTGIKPNAQKAKHAYSSYLKDDDDTPTGTSKLTLSEDMEDEKPAPPPQKKPEAKPQASKTPSKTQNLRSTSSSSSSSSRKSGKGYEVDEDGPDYFSEDSAKEDVGEKLNELKDTLSSLWSNLANTVSALALKFGAIAVKPFVMLAGIAAKVLSVPLTIINRVISSLADKMGVKSRELQAENGTQVEEEEPAPEIKTANFNDMIELNIIFIDNYKKNLYTKQKQLGFKLSKAEENLITGMAIEAIKECAEFTTELPPPTEGIYAGNPISKVMEDVSEQDVMIFLGFVKAFPGKYIGKSWKISETFATWLINNSPTG